VPLPRRPTAGMVRVARVSDGLARQLRRRVKMSLEMREEQELRDSRRRLVEAEHAVRRAIEGALHDGVQQHLTALALELRNAAALVETDPAAAKELLDEMARNNRQAIDEARALAELIYPSFVETGGLASALRAAAARSAVTAVIDGGIGSNQAPLTSSAVYWVCLEALSFASAGSEARIRLHERAGTIAFDVEIDRRPDHDRISALSDRIEALGGEVSVQPTEPDGSIIQGWVPLTS
jgi:signal transduction histidine kinase